MAYDYHGFLQRSVIFWLVLVYMSADVTVSAPKVERKIVEIVKPERFETLSAVQHSDTPKYMSSASSTTPFVRKRPQAKTEGNIYIDIVALADYAIYSRFLRNLGTKSATLQAIREYFAFIFNGVAVRYNRKIKHFKYSFQVRLVKLIIAENSTATGFIEKLRRKGSPWDTVAARTALRSFKAYAVGPGKQVLIPYDHAMLFTGYNLTSEIDDDIPSYIREGKTFKSSMCQTNGKSVSVVQDLGGFQSVESAAHELGHSLSAPVDGKNNKCDPSDRYIMSAGYYFPVKRWDIKSAKMIFSQCSVGAFNKFIRNKLKTQEGKTCLLQQLPISPGVVDVGNRLPGQKYNADDQCRMIFGNASRVCRRPVIDKDYEMCTSMFCYDPNTPDKCYRFKATVGTTCGNGEMCLNEKCSPDARAPKVPAQCVLGDQRGIAIENKTCAEFIKSFIGHCHELLPSKVCCGTCEKVSKAGECPYGDRMRGCNSTVCATWSRKILNWECCGTCGYKEEGKRSDLSLRSLHLPQVSAPMRHALTKRTFLSPVEVVPQSSIDLRSFAIPKV